jgi:hypothetical protein
MAYTILGGTTVYPAQVSYQLINLTDNITLSWPSSFSSSFVAAGYNEVTTAQNGYIITLPDATLASAGVDVIFNNLSAYNFIVNKSDGTLLYTVNAGVIVDLKLYDTSTSAGGWRILPFLGGYNGIVSFTAQSTDNTITITNGNNVQPPGAIINFQLPTSLKNLNNLDVPGIVVATGTDPLTWNAVELVADSNFTITNSDGVDGNPQFALSTSLSGLASIGVGSLTLTGSLISAGVTNGSVEIASDGTGSVYINGVVIDNNTNSNITIPGNLTVNGFFNNPFIPKAWCVFTDVITGDNNDITVQNEQNVTSVTGSAGNYVITFTTQMANINYGVFITCGTNGGPSLPFVSTSYWTVRELTYVSIAIVDASGALVTSVPNGVTVMIMSS